MIISREFAADLFERVLATYLQAFLGLLLAGTFTINIGAVHAAAVAALPAGLSAVKAVLASRVGDPQSASLLTVVPQVLSAAESVE